MIFNKDYNGISEIKALTGSFYANNNFDDIRHYIAQSTQEFIGLFGQSLYQRAEQAYLNNIATDADLIIPVQTPIAIQAVYNLYKHSDISHETTGRKVKIDNDTEKIPWQWQLDRDDALLLEDFYKSIENLVQFLTVQKDKYTQWALSPLNIRLHRLFIRSANQFEQYQPIGNSWHIYQTLIPFIAEEQRLIFRPILSDRYDMLLQEDLNTDDRILVDEYVCPALALLSFSKAILRLPIGIMPMGIVRNYIQANGIQSTAPATDSEIKTVYNQIRIQASILLNELKKQLTPVEPQKLMPDNDSFNKYMML